MRNEPIPEPTAGEVLVEVERAGICGTDRELFRGELAGIHGTVSIIPGHEFVGRVIGGDRDLLGKRVIADPLIGCGRCAACARGTAFTCEHRVEIGVRRRDGALAEYVSIPTSAAHIVGDRLSAAAAAYAEPASNAVRAVKQGGVGPGHRVAVVGAGAIGCLAVQYAAALGATVTVVDTTLESAQKALAFGAHDVTTADSCAGDIRRYDVVIDAADGSSSATLSVRLAAPGGTVVLLGVASAPLGIDPHCIVIGSLTVFGILGGGPALEETIDLLSNDVLTPERLVTAVVSLNEVSEVLSGNRQTVGKIQVDPSIRTTQ